MKLRCRKQLLEAWECAEWDSREAQIRALQEVQLKEFEDSLKAKHAQVAQSASSPSHWCSAHLPGPGDIAPYTTVTCA